LELTANPEVFDFQAGKLTSRQRLSLLNTDFQESVGAAEVSLSPDEKNA
jgi:6-phosphogluconolactonase (cycloisomerase 2 family)